MITWFDTEETDLGALKSVGVDTTLSSIGLWWGGGGCGERVGIVGSGGGGTLAGVGDAAPDVGEPTEGIGTESAWPELVQFTLE